MSYYNIYNTSHKEMSWCCKKHTFIKGKNDVFKGMQKEYKGIVNVFCLKDGRRYLTKTILYAIF